MAMNLLLQLFQGRVFSVQLAVSHLKAYSNSIGVTYYLVNRLAHFPEEEVEFYWPQLCQLLITQPSDSGALEGFIIRKCEESIHLAMLTLWQLQASLSDLSATPTTPQFVICRRAYNRVQHIIFSDPLLETNRQEKIGDNVHPTIAGLGMVAAGIALPALAGFSGKMAIEQGKRRSEPHSVKSSPDSAGENSESDEESRQSHTMDRSASLPSRRASLETPKSTSSSPGMPTASSFKSPRAKKKPSYVPGARLPLVHSPVPSPSTSSYIRQPLPTSKRKYHLATPKIPHSHSMTELPSPTAGSFDVGTPTSSPKVSFRPSFPHSPPASRTPDSVISPFAAKTREHPYSASTSNLPVSTPSFAIPPEIMTKLLRSYACRSQLDLVTSLQDISTRLVVVPKMARLSALRAELTVLNHGLPRGCCLCLGCSGQGGKTPPSLFPTSIFSAPTQRHHPHHRIVRISPSESVVLNSADRAPFLIHVEVLDGDLDFDPSRRQNAEDVRAVMGERDGRRRAKSVEDSLPVVPTPVVEPEPTEPQSAEEVDLVEQLYGNFSVHDPTVLKEYHPEIRNRTADETAWRKAEARKSMQARTLSIDQYAERMKMAAIMLAQLKASQQPVANPVTTGVYAVVGAAMRFGAADAPAPIGQATSGIPASLDVASAAPSAGPSAGFRQRVLSAQEASAIKERIMSEMMALEDERTKRTVRETTEDESVVMRAVNKEDPSGAVFQESWDTKKSRIRGASPYGHLANWDLFSLIVKTGADLRQEQLAVQLIKEFGRIWTEAGMTHWIRYYRILVTSESTGLMETITDAVSIHSIKKQAYSRMTAQNGMMPSYTLYDYFIETYEGPAFRKAQDAFLKSLASYSVICYILQIKDRHNGNILIDRAGHIIHIDFGFMLSDSPGSLGFEMAPFKLTQDYIDILGDRYDEWRALLGQLLRAVKLERLRMLAPVQVWSNDHERLITSAANSAFTRLYDTFQRYSQGVL